MRFQSSVEINACIEKVWALIDDLEQWHKWMPSIHKIERVSKEPLDVGSRLYVTARVSRLKVRLLMEITEFVPKRSVVMEGKALGTRLIRFYRFDPLSGRTRLTIGGEVSGLLVWLARRGGQTVSDEIAKAAKERIESLEE